MQQSVNEQFHQESHHDNESWASHLSLRNYVFLKALSTERSRRNAIQSEGNYSLLSTIAVEYLRFPHKVIHHDRHDFLSEIPGHVVAFRRSSVFSVDKWNAKVSHSILNERKEEKPPSLSKWWVR